MATLDYQEDEKNSVQARDTSDPKSQFKRYPLKPSTWDQVKEAFEPTGTRVMLDAVRKRRGAES